MYHWSLLIFSSALVVLTALIRCLQWFERSQYQCIVNGYELTPQRVPNTYRRDGRRLALGVAICCLLGIPVDDSALGLPMVINLIIALLVLWYWQCQPRRLTIYRLPYRPRVRA